MSLRRSRPTIDRPRLPLLLVAVLAMLAPGLLLPTPSAAKEIDVRGTVDCGERSGRRCTVGETLVVRTADLSGTTAPATIDVRWIKETLPALDQDDEITLAVETLSDGTLRAHRLVRAEHASGTVNPGLSTGSRTVGEARHDRARRQDEDDVSSVLQLGPGRLAGTVRGRRTGLPVAGATVRVDGVSTTTDAAGAFTIRDLAPGAHRVEASAPGFVTQIELVTIEPDSAAQVTFNLAATSPDITVTVTWGAEPTDLDVHLAGPTPAGGRFHTYFLDPTPVPYAALTARDDTSFGPEQVTIGRDPSSQQHVAGDYHVWVHNFSRAPDFSASQARLIVNQDGQPLGTFAVGDATGDPALDLWHVVNLQVDAAGDVTPVPVQRFTNGDSLVILRPPYGDKPPQR